jgi:hypothetical protein
MDIQMSVMNGYEAAKAIRASPHPRSGTIPIIAMTANAFTEDIAAALACGDGDAFRRAWRQAVHEDFPELCRVGTSEIPSLGQYKVLYIAYYGKNNGYRTHGPYDSRSVFGGGNGRTAAPLFMKFGCANIRSEIFRPETPAVCAPTGSLVLEIFGDYV